MGVRFYRIIKNLQKSLVSHQTFVGLQGVLKMSSRHVIKRSSKLLDRTKCLLRISVSNKSISHKSIVDKSKANPKSINNLNNFDICLILKLNQPN